MSLGMRRSLSQSGRRPRDRHMTIAFRHQGIVIKDTIVPYLRCPSPSSSSPPPTHHPRLASRREAASVNRTLHSPSHHPILPARDDSTCYACHSVLARKNITITTSFFAICFPIPLVLMMCHALEWTTARGARSTRCRAVETCMMNELVDQASIEDGRNEMNERTA